MLPKEALMQAAEVYAVLRQIGVTQLHHANTVTTSCTFLEQGGLASRGFVEDRHLSQTAQPASDEIDKRYGIWHDVFLDHVDIHYRAGLKARTITALSYSSLTSTFSSGSRPAVTSA